MGVKSVHLAEDAEKQAFYARRIAKYIATAPGNHFTVEQVTQGQPYPVAEVEKYLHQSDSDVGPDISEGQAIHEIEERGGWANLNSPISGIPA